MKKRAFALITALCMTLTCFASAETVKHERVYAVTNAAGDALTVIDNVRLENGDALTEIDDRTLLTALENVGGTEKFTQSGETVTWKADGNSIIYQGTSDKVLNVTPVVHMTLDGKEVTAADVKNASGELAMTVSYRAESPFLAVTVMPLTDDVTSVTVDNGAVLTDGAHSFLMGFGIPGADADLELPDSFTMTAHVDHADLNWMMTIATAQPVKVLTDALSDHAADAHALVSDLTAGLNALADGSDIPESNEDIHELLTALNTLFDGAAQLKDGSITLLDGVKTLKDGLDTLSSNSTALNDGAAQLFAAVLDTANTQLAAAGLDALSIEVPTLTASNYATVLDNLIAQLDPAVIDKTIEDLAKEQVREAVMAQEDKVREAVTEVVRSGAGRGCRAGRNHPRRCDRRGEGTGASGRCGTGRHHSRGSDAGGSGAGAGRGSSAGGYHPRRRDAGGSGASAGGRAGAGGSQYDGAAVSGHGCRGSGAGRAAEADQRGG